MIAAIYSRKSNEQRDRDEADKSVTHQDESAREHIAPERLDGRGGPRLPDDGISRAGFNKRKDLVRLRRDVDQKRRPPFQHLRQCSSGGSGG